MLVPKQYFGRRLTYLDLLMGYWQLVSCFATLCCHWPTFVELASAELHRILLLRGSGSLSHVPHVPLFRRRQITILQR